MTEILKWPWSCKRPNRFSSGQENFW